MQHLTEDQLSAAAIGEAEAETTAHLAACAACRAEHESLARTLGGLSALAESQAARPAGFWYAQRAAIAAQLGGRGLARPRLVVWAGALAALTLTAGMLPQAPQIGSAPDYTASRIDAIDDHELLMDVERSVQRTVPRALEPATALAQEMADALRETENPANNATNSTNGSRN